jgi:phosphoribosylformylglycinamidine synthase
MAHRIEIGFKRQFSDPLGNRVRTQIWEDLNINLESVYIVQVYTIDYSLGYDQLELIVKSALLDPIVQEYAIDSPLFKDFDWLIEIGFKPYVTDNVGRTAKEAIEILLQKELPEEKRVYTSKQYLLKGRLKRREVEKIAYDLLANLLIHRCKILDYQTFVKQKGTMIEVPKAEIDTPPLVQEISLEVSNDQLLEISRKRTLALNLEELLTIKSYYQEQEFRIKREKIGLSSKITDVELEALAQTWSEHCKHKIFKAEITYIDEESNHIQVIDGLFDTFIKGATEKIKKELDKEDFCVSVFTDNAGIIKFDQNYNLVFKVETHNTPSALDPYGGALTGIVGVNRDPLGTGMGARLIFNTNVFCLAPPTYNKPLPPKLLHPKRILEGVRLGVEHGGNKSGIPTINGSLVFDERYLGKPLVYCGTGGIIPRQICGLPSHQKKVSPGDLIVMVGGRIGKDGIHGATFSSEELSEHSPFSAVQIGDPIVQKRMSDFLLKARDEGLFSSITDNGAGGLSCSVGEMAQSSGGCELELESAPLKYTGLVPWEILLSEAQERMTLAVPPKNIERLLNLAKKMKVEASILGSFTNTGLFHVKYKGKTVACLDMEFLHHGLPKMKLEARWKPIVHKEPQLPLPQDLGKVLQDMLTRLNICSKEYWVRQYDHEVQGATVIKPLVGKANDGPSDAAVLKPLFDSYRGIVVSHGICPKYSDIDPYHMMACAIDEAVRNAVSVGANPNLLAGLDNFCWCDPIKSEKNPDGDLKLGWLVRACMALYDYCYAYRIPCISGKDSMKNDYRVGEIKISIPPTVLFSILGQIEDVRKAVTMDVKREGDLVYVIGVTKEELGGSEYFRMRGLIGNSVPRVPSQEAYRRYQLLHQAIMRGFISSAHDCSDGGIGVALAEAAFAGEKGIEVDLRSIPQKGIQREDFLLFSESQARFVVTIPPQSKPEFERLMAKDIISEIGRVIEKKELIFIGFDGKICLKKNIYNLKNAWKSTFGA